MMTPPPCTAAQLSAFDGGAVPHGNRFVTTILLANDSAKTCTISGYPNVAFLFSNGKPESVTVRYTQRDVNFKASAPAAVTIQPGYTAQFLLGYPKADAHGNTCDAVSTISIRGFPNDGVLRLPDTISPCSTINISPYSISHA